MFRTPDPDGFVTRARERGVLVGRFDAERLRAVTHLDIGTETLEEALDRLRGLFSS